MSQPKSPTEFIQDSFAPLVAVLCSADAEALCRKNNLKFADMLQPFSKMTTDVQFRDASNIAHAVKNFRVRFRDLRENYLHPNAAKMYMHAVVDRLCEQEALQTASGPKSDLQNGSSLQNADYSDIQVEWNTRWFDAYRELAVRMSQPSDHEFVRTFVGCLFVVSTSCNEPLAAFSNLTSEQYTHQHSAAARYPRWFHSTVLKHFVLLHDVEESAANAETLFEDLKMAYGPANCTLLRINSRSAADVRRGDADQQANPFGLLMQYDELAAAGLSSVAVSQSVANSDTQNAPMKGSKSMCALSRPEEEDGTENRPLMDDSTMESVLKHSVSMNLATGTNGDNDSVNGALLRDPLGVDEVAASYDEPLNAAVATPTARNLVRSAVRYGAFLTPADIDRLRAFVHELLLHGVLPFLERTLRTLAESAANSKKSVQRSMLQLTKKLFSGSSRKPGNAAGIANSSTTSSENAISIVYTNDSAELQLRKYADLALALQQYESAFQTYQSLRRDFQNEDAWLHYAGASEMCAVCLFLQQSSAHTHTQRQYPAHYMDEAISTYLSVCRNVAYATRAAILSTEILKAKRSHAEAIAHYLRLTAEDSDLRSALFLEQAALCYAAQSRPAMRKYAFHLVLAGFRFSKAGLRRHSLRCYDAAWQLLRTRGWLLAEDLVMVTLARHLHALHSPNEALQTFKLLFTRDEQCESNGSGNGNLLLARSPAQTLAYLIEFLTLYRQHLNEQVAEQAFADLQLPTLLFSRTKVLLCDDPDQLDSEEAAVQQSVFRSVNFSDLDDQVLLDELVQLEDALIRHANCKRVDTTNAPMPARTRCYGYRVSDLRNQNAVDVLADCPVRLLLHLRNPLNVRLQVRNVRLLCRFESQDLVEPECASSYTVPSLTLEGLQLQTLQLCLRPEKAGTLVALGITYELALCDAVPADIQSTLPLPLPVRQNFPRSLAFRVRHTPSAPVLNLLAPIACKPLPAGSLVPVTLSFKQRCSPAETDMIQLDDDNPTASIRNVKLTTSSNSLLVTTCNDCVIHSPTASGSLHVHKSSSTFNVMDLSLASTSQCTLWLRVPEHSQARVTRISVLVYFEHGKHFYLRALQCTLQTTPALRVQVQVQRSLSCWQSSCSLLATVSVHNQATSSAEDEGTLVTLTHLTAVSGRFVLNGLLSPSNEIVAAQHSCQFAVRLLPKYYEPEALKYTSLALHNCTNSEQQLVNDCNQAPSLSFYQLERKNDEQSGEQMCKNDSRDVQLDFILCWRIAHLIGQSHVFVPRIELDELVASAERSLTVNEPEPPLPWTPQDAALQRSANARLVNVAFQLQVHSTASHSAQIHVKHCFAKQRVCVLPVTVHLHRLVNAAVRVRVDACSKRVAYRTSPPASPAGSPLRHDAENVGAVNETQESARCVTNVTCMPRNAALYGAVIIVGCSAFELQLDSEAKHEQNHQASVCVHLGISQAGIYDIAECFDVSACLQRSSVALCSDNQLVSQTYVPTCMLVVENVDK